MSKYIEEFNPLNVSNIGKAIAIYEEKVKELQITEESQGKQLLTYLKRDKTLVGPYPDTTFFESANRAIEWLFQD